MVFVKLGENKYSIEIHFYSTLFCPLLTSSFSVSHLYRNGESLIIEQFFPSLLTQGLFPPAHSNPNSGVELMKFSAS